MRLNLVDQFPPITWVVASLLFNKRMAPPVDRLMKNFLGAEKYLYLSVRLSVLQTNFLGGAEAVLSTAWPVIALI